MEISSPLSSTSAFERLCVVAESGAPSVSALTSALAAGDEEAFRKFHSLFFNRLLRYHLVIAHGDENSAREALQETYLRVVRHAKRFDDERAFWSWLTVLARSAACDGGRARQRYCSLLGRYARTFITSHVSAEPEDADSILTENLTACMDELAELDRELVEGKYLCKLSVRELAAEHKLTEKAVESRLLRARRLLRQSVLTRMCHEE